MTNTNDPKKALQSLRGGKIIQGAIIPGIPARLVFLLDFEGQEIVPGVRDGGTRKELIIQAPVGLVFALQDPVFIIEAQEKPQ
ncbi:MAG: hypothetical protein IH888_04255 [Planctomycetes bacterium]|nr:hypothetical protein [Planctomycetota bacterium]